MKNQQRIRNFLKGSLTVLISVLVIYGVVQANTTIATPSGTPVASFYTLSDIWTRLTTNGVATEGNHSFTFADPLAGTHVTLTQVYNAIPTIDATKVLSGTSYLGVSGTMANNGAFSLAASPTDQAVIAGYYSGGTLAGDADLVTGNIKSGVNIFGVAGDSNVVNTSTGDAVAGDILSGKVAWIDGLEITGTIPTQTLSAASGTVSAGYYNATTLSTVDTDLISSNILSGKTIFGVAGNVNAGYTYGDSVQNTVLTTATGAGTYNASNLSVNNVRSGTTFGVSSTGTMYGDTDASKVCSNATTAGTLSVTAAYISTGNTYCGTAGTLLANLFNGTSGAFTGGSQANGGADDYNNGGAGASGRYVKGWTACTSGNSYCGTSDSGADAKDDSTGLIWSMPCNGSGCASFADTTPLAYSWDSLAANNASATASALCSNHAGWSLPHQKQLMQAYIDGSYGNLEASGVNRNYWSATTSSAGTTNAWLVSLSYGYTYNTTKTNTLYVRCVR